MPGPAPLFPPNPSLSARLAELEQRVGALETRLSATRAEAPQAFAPETTEATPAPRASEELEIEVGKNWFGRGGILVLAAGGAFLLAQPYSNLPRGAPPLTGLAVGVVLLLVAHAGRHSFELLSRYLRGAAMALLAFATLRFFYFTPQPLLQATSFVGRLMLIMIAVVNLLIAFRHRSPRLVVLALLGAAACALGTNSTAIVLTTMVALAAIVATAAVRCGWPVLIYAGIAICAGTYGLWAAGNPLVNGAFHVAAAPTVGLEIWLLAVVILALGPMFGHDPEDGEMLDSSLALTNCAVGYGLFLLHAAKAFLPQFAVLQVIASAVLLGIALVFWGHHQSRGSTFFYAMTAYVALSLAIIKAAEVPDVFVWLALQSIVVVVTAIWFRSRFIVVANFIIYVFIAVGYLILHERETGISLVFGLVALMTARLLNWKQGRLELKTELMRNAYLVTAFASFPYALSHLASPRLIAPAWVALALGYYGLSFLFRNPKYRWMGHGTLLLAVVYLIAAGRQLQAMDRVVSLLAVGTVLLIVSVAFSRVRRGAGSSTTAGELPDGIETARTRAERAANPN